MDQDYPNNQILYTRTAFIVKHVINNTNNIFSSLFSDENKYELTFYKILELSLRFWNFCYPPQHSLSFDWLVWYEWDPNHLDNTMKKVYCVSCMYEFSQIYRLETDVNLYKIVRGPHQLGRFFLKIHFGEFIRSDLEPYFKYFVRLSFLVVGNSCMIVAK